jgi:hypothetical protein
MMNERDKMMWAVAGWLALTVSGAAGAEKAKGETEKEPARPALATVEEMGPIAELSWGPCKAEDHAAAAAQAEWRRLCPWAAMKITPELARSLSRWAKQQMETYRKVSPLEKVAFQPVRVEKEGGRILLEGTVDDLPVHAPLVSRWLKVYLVYEPQQKRIERVIVTIRGERRE